MDGLVCIINSFCIVEPQAKSAIGLVYTDRHGVTHDALCTRIGIPSELGPGVNHIVSAETSIFKF